MICLVRCDDRLIHGQCMTRVVKEYDIQDIIVVDDYTAGEPMLKKIFQMAVPREMNANVYTAEESYSVISKAMSSPRRTLVLMKSPEVMVKLVDGVKGMPMELDIGPMSAREGATTLTPYAHLMPNELAAVKKLTEENVHVYLKQLPTEATTELKDLKNKI